MSTAARLKEVTKRVVRRLIPAHVRFQRAGREFLASGEREVHELPALVEPGTVAIDVGSLVGDYAYSLCRAVGPEGQVVCVEPQPEYARLLRAAAAHLKLPMRVVECALSSRSGAAELSVPIVEGRTLVGFASLDHATSAGRTLKVHLLTLDELTAGIGKRISFIKVDVEGHELAVLKGGTATLRQHRPNLLVEIEQRHSPVPITQTFDFLAAQGYSGYFLGEGGARMPLAEFDPERNHALCSGGRAGGTLGTEYVANFIFVPIRNIANISRPKRGTPREAGGTAQVGLDPQ